MRDSTYVVLALALCSLALLFLTLQPQKVWMMDLEDFRTLPVELRSVLRRMMPDPVMIRQRWSIMTPDQKRFAVQQLSNFMPQARAPHMPVRPPPVIPPTPVQVPEPEPEPDTPKEPEPEFETLKKGFLDSVKKGKKKDTKHKKQDQVVTLGVVGTDASAPTEGGHGATGEAAGFLGGDD
jgi:hypothetical protein